MTAREYLSQGCRLEQFIACDVRRLEEARELARSIPSSFADRNRVCTSLTGEAPFVRAVERADAIRRKIAAELDLLLALKEQMERVISSVPGEELRLILTFRYLEHKTFPEIAELLNISRNTARARHDRALSRLTLPDCPIDIRHTDAVTAHI